MVRVPPVPFGGPWKSRHHASMSCCLHFIWIHNKLWLPFASSPITLIQVIASSLLALPQSHPISAGDGGSQSKVRSGNSSTSCHGREMPPTCFSPAFLSLGRTHTSSWTWPGQYLPEPSVPFLTSYRTYLHPCSFLRVSQSLRADGGLLTPKACLCFRHPKSTY